MRLLLTGFQGSGKTTQAKIISEKLGLCLIKLGELLRQRATADDDTGRLLRQALEEGVLVQNSVAAALLKTELSSPKCARGVVVDGYPRSLTQLTEFDPDYDKVVCLDISEEEAVSRLLQRGREDDTREAIENRLTWYKEDTQKTISYFEGQGILIHIDGQQPVDKVTEEILEKI